MRRPRTIVKLARKYAPYVALFLMAAVYAVALSIVSIDGYNRFAYSAFDLGLFDQGIWLVSIGRDPFITIRGMHLFGDHIQFTSVLFAPFYAVWNDARALLVAQSVVLASGAVPLFLIAKEKLKSQYVSLAFPFCYLLYPALHYLNLENFHPVTLAVPMLLSAFYFMTRKRYAPYLALVVLLLLTREELIFTVLALGAYAFLFHDRRIGIATALLALVWIPAVFYVVFPHYIQFYTPFQHPNMARGGGITDIIGAVISPQEMASRLGTQANLAYLSGILAPVAFVPLLQPQVFMLALPALAINMITGWPYAHSIEYHYTYAIIPFVFISVVYVFSSAIDIMKKRGFRFRKAALWLAVSALVAASIAGNVAVGPGSTSVTSGRFAEIFEAFWNANPRDVVMQEAVAVVPGTATVSASYLFVPHMSHREVIYMFPNPFREAYWGAEFGNFTPPTPTKDVDYIVLDGTVNEFERETVVRPLLESGAYYKIFEKEGVAVLRRSVTLNNP